MIRNYVHLKRQQGDSLFTQKDTLQEAFELLFKNLAKYPQDQNIKEVERLPNNRIKMR